MTMEKLSEKGWKPFQIDEEFDIKSGVRLESRNRTPGERPFIGALDNSNGVVQFVSNKNASLDSNFLGVNYNGNGMGIGFYHPYECICTDDVKRFHQKHVADSEELALFDKTVIEKQRGKFGYLYKFNATRMAKTDVLLPVTDSGEPDYDYMAEYTKQTREKLLSRYREYVEKRIAELGEEVEIPALNEKEWKKFKAFGDTGILEIATTNSSIDGIRLIEGDEETLPYVTRSESNNGIARFVCEKNKSFGFDRSESITVGLDTQTAYWQPHEFVTGQNIQVITGEHLNEWSAQFLIPLLRMQMKAKFNWGGNGATLKRMKTLDLMLPVNDSGEPDYEYMEQYVKNIMLRKYKQYLAFLSRKEKKHEWIDPRTGNGPYFSMDESEGRHEEFH